MDQNAMMAAIAAAGVFIALLTFHIGRATAVKAEGQQQGSLKTDVAYIKEQVGLQSGLVEKQIKLASDVEYIKVQVVEIGLRFTNEQVAMWTDIKALRDQLQVVTGESLITKERLQGHIEREHKRGREMMQG